MVDVHPGTLTWSHGGAEGDTPFQFLGDFNLGSMLISRGTPAISPTSQHFFESIEISFFPGGDMLVTWRVP